MRCGLARMKAYVDSLPREADMTAASRIAGTLLARVEYGDEQILASPDLTVFCDEMIGKIRGLHDAIERRYFPV